MAIELLDGMDWAVLADAQTWFVGWPDISTLILPLTTLTGPATMHGANFMDEPWELHRVPPLDRRREHSGRELFRAKQCTASPLMPMGCLQSRATRSGPGVRDHGQVAHARRPM